MSLTRTLPSLRTVFGLVFLASVVLLAAALYLQHRIGLDPCALCISQRIALLAAGLAAGLAWLHNPGRRGQCAWAVLMMLCALAGAGLAARQLWIQHLPADRVPACGPGIDYILEVFPWQEALALLLKGDGNCAEVSWTLLGISIAGWTLPAFLAIALAGLRAWWPRPAA